MEEKLESRSRSSGRNFMIRSGAWQSCCTTYLNGGKNQGFLEKTGL